MPEPIDRLHAALEDRYAIERKLGEGGMATVYLARDERHDRSIAIKVLKPELAAVLGAERFLTEIRTTANLQHPHILALFDSGEADGFLFYVMPYVEGETLRDRLDRERQLPVDDAVAIGTGVAAALDYAHRQGVIHRDIKPANILLHDGQPLVADFGIALAVSEAGGGRLTETGLSLGTPHYMSPEQATGEQDVGPTSDVYALGCVLHEMLAGEPPFTGATAQAVLTRVLTAEPPMLGEVRRSVPRYVELAVRKALEKIPADRFTSASALSDALNDTHFGAALSGSSSRGDGRSGRGIGLAWGVSLMATALAVWLLARVTLSGGGGLSDGPVVRFPVPDFEGIELYSTPSLLRDGSGAAIIGEGPQGRGIYVQRFDGSPLTLLPTDRAAVGLLDHPDGSGVVYYTFDSPEGLAPLRISSHAGTPPRLWTDSLRLWFAIDDEGWIYGSHHLDRYIGRVDPTGTQFERVTTKLDGEQSHGRPYPLPRRRGVLFHAEHSDGARLAAVDADGVRHDLGPGRAPHLLAGDILVFEDDRLRLMAVRFDVDTLQPVGVAIPVLGGLGGGNLPGARWVLLPNGTLQYEEADNRHTLLRQTVEGVDSITAFDHEIDRIALNPSETAIAFDRDGEIWIHEFGGTRRRLELEGQYRFMDWSPRGDALLVKRLYAAGRPGLGAAGTVAADGSGAFQPIAGADSVTEASWSQAGQLRVSVSGGSRVVTTWVAEGAIPRDVTVGSSRISVSPDGRYLAVVETRPGLEVKVVGLPPVSGAWSLGLGSNPRWSANGNRLYFTGPSIAYQETLPSLMGMDVRTDGVFSHGPVEVAAEPPALARAWHFGDEPGEIYWITRQRIPQTYVVLNWHRQVERLLSDAETGS